MDKQLWGVLVEGPDDVYACENEDAAKLLASELNEEFRKFSDVPLQAAACKWPFSNELHQERLPIDSAA